MNDQVSKLSQHLAKWMRDICHLTKSEYGATALQLYKSNSVSVGNRSSEMTLSMLKYASFPRSCSLQEQHTFPSWASPWEWCLLDLGTGHCCESGWLPDRWLGSALEPGGTRRGEHASHWPGWEDTGISHSQSFPAPTSRWPTWCLGFVMPVFIL